MLIQGLWWFQSAERKPERWRVLLSHCSSKELSGCFPTTEVLSGTRSWLRFLFGNERDRVEQRIGWSKPWLAERKCQSLSFSALYYFRGDFLGNFPATTCSSGKSSWSGIAVGTWMRVVEVSEWPATVGVGLMEAGNLVNCPVSMLLTAPVDKFWVLFWRRWPSLATGKDLSW